MPRFVDADAECTRSFATRLTTVVRQRRPKPTEAFRFSGIGFPPLHKRPLKHIALDGAALASYAEILSGSKFQQVRAAQAELQPELVMHFAVSLVAFCRFPVLVVNPGCFGSAN